MVSRSMSSPRGKNLRTESGRIEMVQCKTPRVLRLLSHELNSTEFCSMELPVRGRTNGGGAQLNVVDAFDSGREPCAECE
jgi:hypothetical protein